MADSYSYRIIKHDGEKCYLLLFPSHFNHFLFYMFEKINRLNYTRPNQKKLKCEEYVYLKNVMTKSEIMLSELRTMVVLVSTFTVGSCNMHD